MRLDWPDQYGNRIREAKGIKAAQIGELLARLPALVLETEMQIKGESSEADVALAHLLGRLASAAKAA